jgi:hypothetical protein
LLAQVRYVVCSDATPVASTYEGFRTGEGTRPSTLLAQVRYVVCSDATPVASTYEGFRTDGSACPSTLLAQVRYVVADVAIESFLDMESDGLKAELQQCPMDPQGGGGTPSSASLPVFGTSSDFRADGIICGSIVGIAGYAPIEAG